MLIFYGGSCQQPLVDVAWGVRKLKSTNGPWGHI